MNWIDRDITFFYHPSNDSDFFLHFLKELPEINVGLAVFSGIFTIGGELIWFEEKIAQGFDEEIRKRIGSNGSLVNLRLKYLYSVDPEDEEKEKLFFNGESLFGN